MYIWILGMRVCVCIAKIYSSYSLVCFFCVIDSTLWLYCMFVHSAIGGHWSSHLASSLPLTASLFPHVKGSRAWRTGWGALLQGVCLGELLLGHKMTNCFPWRSDTCTVPPTMRRSCICFTFSPEFDIVRLFSLLFVKWYLVVVFICVSLVTDKVE